MPVNNDLITEDSSNSCNKESWVLALVVTTNTVTVKPVPVRVQAVPCSIEFKQCR